MEVKLVEVYYNLTNFLAEIPATLNGLQVENNAIKRSVTANRLVLNSDIESYEKLRNNFIVIFDIWLGLFTTIPLFDPFLAPIKEIRNSL